MIKIGTIVTEYLSTNKLLKTKVAIADFLFEYFALFKAFELPKKPTSPSPEDYTDLPYYYIQHGITKESVRLMMKDAPKVGDF